MLEVYLVVKGGGHKQQQQQQQDQTGFNSIESLQCPRIGFSFTIFLLFYFKNKVKSNSKRNVVLFYI